MADPMYEPKSIQVLKEGLEVQWKDGHRTLLPHQYLRGHCGCAQCVDEMTQRRRVAVQDVAADIHVEDFIEVGTPLDAKVSHELLLSIFHPTSPIHDGAVVIRGNRIIAAGCFLPLSLSAAISKIYGTRHRAGIGLSEETDAIIIIISEETGAISTAVSGKLEKNVDMGSLRDFLTETFTSPKNKKT